MRPYDWYEAGLFCAEDDPLFRVPEMEVVGDPWGLPLVGVFLLLALLAMVGTVAFTLSLK